MAPTEPAPDHPAAPVQVARDEPTPQATHGPVRGALRDKLPEILIEAASVVVAILLAFAVDEWREARSRAALAHRARDFILAEIRANRDELRGTSAANQQTLELIGRQIAALATAKDASVTTAMNVSQLSTAAFDAAKATQAAQVLEFEWLVRVGRTYELQKQYLAVQDIALADVGAAGGVISAGESPRAVMQRLEGRLRTVQSLSKALVESYDEVLRATP